MLYEVNILIAQ